MLAIAGRHDYLLCFLRNIPATIIPGVAITAVAYRHLCGDGILDFPLIT